MEDCIFCKIVKNDIPNYRVYENDLVSAFLDVLPIHPGHTVIVSKRHVADVESLKDDELCAMSLAFKKIGQAMIDGLGVKGYSVFLDNKDAANQHVPHVHYHVVPRVTGDGLERWPSSGYDEGEAEKTLANLKAKL